MNNLSTKDVLNIIEKETLPIKKTIKKFEDAIEKLSLIINHLETPASIEEKKFLQLDKKLDEFTNATTKLINR